MKRVTAALLVLPALGATLSLAATATAKDTSSSRLDTPQIYRDLVDCRQIADSAARLACYDQKVAALEQAKDARDIVIADKSEVREARKGLFGFTLPSLKIFGSGAGEDDEIKQIDGVVKSARQDTYGAWQFTLEDGAVWTQIDTERVVFDPHAGSKVTIKHGALGSYKANIDGQPGIKVRRIQ